MKLLVTGAHGQLGQTLQAHAPADVKMVCVDLPELDISERDQVQAIVQREAPDVIVNCAAYTAVDLAESAPDVASRVNADGPKILAAASIDTGARLIHISTDFVFNGQASEPYRPESIADPLSVYGDTKWEGERGVRETLPDSSIVLRTSWLYSEYGGNFVGTMLRLFSERDEISVVDDQVGSPTWCQSVAKAIFEFVDAPAISGTYHWTDSGQTSWYGFACAIQEEALKMGIISKAIRISPIASSDYPTAATRPAYSVLDCSSTANDLGLQQTPWRQSLRAMLEVLAR
jgi:dTDP-4-dehydrorhamnose reductase